MGELSFEVTRTRLIRSSQIAQHYFHAAKPDQAEEVVSMKFSPHNDPGVAHDSLTVLRNVPRSCVLYQLCLLRSQSLGGGQHRHRRTESAHADALVYDCLVKPTRIEREDSLNGLVVFHARGGIVLVMVHVAGSDDQHGLF